jgi:predicted DNA-binding protein (MmcQ/YjbR family)
MGYRKKKKRELKCEEEELEELD